MGQTTLSLLGGWFTTSMKRTKNKREVLAEKGIITDFIKIGAKNREVFVQAFWDTGATYTCINKRFAENQGLIPTGNTYSLETPTGKVEIETYVISVMIDNIPYTIQAGVFNNPDVPFEIIIGLDIILTGSFSLRNENDNVVFEFTPY